MLWSSTHNTSTRLAKSPSNTSKGTSVKLIFLITVMCKAAILRILWATNTHISLKVRIVVLNSAVKLEALRMISSSPLMMKSSSNFLLPTTIKVGMLMSALSCQAGKARLAQCQSIKKLADVPSLPTDNLSQLWVLETLVSWQATNSQCRHPPQELLEETLELDLASLCLTANNNSGLQLIQAPNSEAYRSLLRLRKPNRNKSRSRRST